MTFTAIPSGAASVICRYPFGRGERCFSPPCRAIVSCVFAQWMPLFFIVLFFPICVSGKVPFFVKNTLTPSNNTQITTIKKVKSRTFVIYSLYLSGKDSASRAQLQKLAFENCRGAACLRACAKIMQSPAISKSRVFYCLFLRFVIYGYSFFTARNNLELF